MSLFKTQDLWTTQCGKDEIFDTTSIAVAEVDGISKGCECIIVGSQNGILRIFQPHLDLQINVEYKPIDLFIETQLSQPILQVVVGKLVSGSHHVHLGVLHQKSFAVYSVVTVPGSTEHGDQCHLMLAYEHQLKKAAYSCVVGPFGGVKGRDFICIQSLDGTISFLEQETFALNQSLPCFLLPSPITYVPQSDSFIVLNANWCLESYRYDVLGDDSNRKLVPSWSYNIGEIILGIQTVTWMGNEAAILVLGEKNLFWFRDSGSLKLEKRLQYNPCCFHVYVTEPDHNLMLLVVTDTLTLLVYDQTSLCWSSQLPFLPVAICRANFMVQGLIVCLSESGELQCCYLGTEPSVFVAPPLDNILKSYDEMQQRLVNVQNEIDSFSQTSVFLTVAPLQVITSHELQISSRVLSLTGNRNECQLEILLTPSTPLNNVQLTLYVQPSLKVNPATHQLPSLCEKTEIGVKVTYLPDCSVPVISLDVVIVAIYVTNTMIPRVLQSHAVLPLPLILVPAAPVKEATHKITLAVSQPTVPLSQVFSELFEEDWLSLGCTDSAAGFSHRSVPDIVVTIVISKSSPRYRIQGENLSAMYLVISLLVTRIEAYYNVRHKPITISHQTSVLPLPVLLSTIDHHVTLRKTILSLKEDLALQAAQFRAIQRRLLAKLKNKTPTSLSNLDTLLNESYTQILDTSHKVEDLNQELQNTGCELGCMIHLVLLLIKLSETASHSDIKDLSAVLTNTLHSSDEQGWEEISEAGLTYLLRTSLAKSVRDQQRTNIIPLKDTGRFKKHIAAALDRAATGNHSQLQNEMRAVSPIMEGEEDISSARSNRRSSIEGLGSRLKLLPTRKVLKPYVKLESSDTRDEDRVFTDDDVYL